MCVSESEKCSFFGIFGVLYFFVTLVLRFALLPYYRRIRGFGSGYYSLKKKKLFRSFDAVFYFNS